jgi:hypothetical protein
VTETTASDSIVIMIAQERLRCVGSSVLRFSLASASCVCNRFACGWKLDVAAKARGLHASSLHELLNC